MPKSTKNYSDPFVPVTTVPLFTSDGEQSSRNAVMIDTEAGRQEVGIVSDNYQLVQNAIVHDIAEDVLDRTQMSFEEDRFLFDGKRYRQRWILPDLQMEPAVGDFVHLAMDLINSYDGSTTFGLAFNARRLVCSNGMMVDFMLGGFRFKHFGNENFVNELQNAAERIRRLAPQLEPMQNRLKQLVETPVNREDIQQTFTELKLPKSTQAEVFMSIEEDTQWGLYNACTHVLTRQESHRADNLNRQVTRFLMAA